MIILFILLCSIVFFTVSLNRLSKYCKKQLGSPHYIVLKCDKCHIAPIKKTNGLGEKVCVDCG